MMTVRHKLAFPVAITLVSAGTIMAHGCRSPESALGNTTSVADPLHPAVIAAMCAPWGEARIAALQELAVAVEAADVEEGARHEVVSDMAADVRPEDCVRAGFPNPGPPIVPTPNSQNNEVQRPGDR